MDVEELKRNMPTYVLDADYLTKIKDRPPDSKALDIEAMLASELQLRMGEDEEFQPLSERLKRIVQRKRSGTVAGLALLKELEELAKETITLIQESQRPIAESIAKAAQERSPGFCQARMQPRSSRRSSRRLTRSCSQDGQNRNTWTSSFSGSLQRSLRKTSRRPDCTGVTRTSSRAA